MAGGKFDPAIGKVRPGTYINTENVAPERLPTGTSGVVTMPLIGHDYGDAGKFIRISGASPDAAKTELGYSVFDTTARNMIAVKEALKNAAEVLVYIPVQGAKASWTNKTSENAVAHLTATAKHGGARGNALRFSIVAAPTGGFDVNIYLGTDKVEVFEGVKTAKELATVNSQWLDFEGAGDLTATAGEALTGGETGATTNGDVAKYIDASDGENWNVMAIPVMSKGEDDTDTPALLEAVKSKIISLRDGSGKYRTAVVSGLAANHEAIINVTNGVVLDNGVEVTADLATAYVAGLYAAAGTTKSYTNVIYSGAVKVIEPKNDEQAIAAIKNGEFFFSVGDSGDVVIEYDINTLTDFAKPKGESWRKNRVIRVIDGFNTELKLRLPPNRYDNTETGHSQMLGIGKALLDEYRLAGAIKNVDLDGDIYIDEEKSGGDEVYIVVAIQPVDSAEKLYITVKTR